MKKKVKQLIKSKKTKNVLLKTKRVRLKTNSKDAYATQGLVLAVRNELKADITSLGLKMSSEISDVKSKFKGMDARFKQVDARFKQVDARFKQVDARFDKIDSQFSEMKSHISDIGSKINRTLILVEAQYSENQTIWAQQNVLVAGQERIEERLDILEKACFISKK